MNKLRASVVVGPALKILIRVTTQLIVWWVWILYSVEFGYCGKFRMDLITIHGDLKQDPHTFMAQFSCFSVSIFLVRVFLVYDTLIEHFI